MLIFKCKICGGTLEFNPGDTIAICNSCDTKQTIPRLDDDRRANLYDRANHFRRNNEYDKAMGIYEKILDEDGKDAEAYWSIVLCKYGIEYVEDPVTHKRVPTVNRTQYTSIFDDSNYKSAIQYADPLQRQLYEEEASVINEIQKGILSISQNEEPFDIFICYKETDASGRRTQDSVLANDLYHQLTQEGFRVFFSRITLEDKLGTAYEPYIFAALNSAKVMVVIGTKPEHFNAVWVKNEWSRYLSLIKNGARKTLIPAYKDIDPYDLPDEFAHLQAQDMSKLGFMQDLIRGIKKTVADESAAVSNETSAASSSATSNNIAPLLKRAFMFLEDGDFSKADEYCERVLDLDPENAQAYLGKLMAEQKVKKQENLANCNQPFDDNSNYKKAVGFADDDLRTTLIGYIKQINARKKETAKRLAPFMEILKDKNCPVSIACGYDFTIGLKADGTVVSTDKFSMGRCIENWTNIVSIACGEKHTVGLKADGTVVAAGDNEFDQCWRSGRGVISIACSSHRTFFFRADGSIIASGFPNTPFIRDWTDFVSIAFGETHSVGLKADGTIVTTGDNKNGQCDVKHWTDIVSVACGDNHTVGLKSDGSVVATGDNREGQCNVEDWANIVSIACGRNITVGLKADGTVVDTYSHFGGAFIKGNLEYWEEIVYISCGNYHIVGLRADGTVVATGFDIVSYGKREVSRWKLFDNLNQLKELTENRYQSVEKLKKAAEEEKIRCQALELQAKRRAQNVCQHCGGDFRGLFTKVCSKCGKEKDY